MGITVEELNKKYKAEDKLWDFSLFPIWLQKHGIPDSNEAPVVKLTLGQVLLEFTPEILPEKHYDFDRKVLEMAEANKAKLSSAMIKVIEASIEESVKKHLGGNRWGKAWRAVRGKL
jgi:hypothetical protein